MTSNDTKKSESEVHYKSLLSYFNNLIRITSGIFIILITIVGVLFFQDRAAMKDEVSEVKYRSIEAIKHAEVSTEEAIRVIKEDAAEQAKLSVVETLKEKNVEEIIREWVADSAKTMTEKIISEAEDNLKIYVLNMSKIIDAAMKMRSGSKLGLLELYGLKNSLKDENLIDFSIKYYNEIRDEYDLSATIRFKRKIPKDGNDNSETLSIFNYATNIPKLLNRINNSNDLVNIADAFAGMRYATKENFEMFNFNQVNDWCKSNPSKCAEDSN